jgi:PmbA protein
MELEAVAARAIDAALGTGAEAAEAYAEDSTSREVRVFGGEVESLTDAGQRGVGVRAWIGGRVGYAYGTDLSDAALGELGAAAVEAARVADADEFAAPATPDGAGPPPEIPGLADAALERWPTDRKVALTKAIEAAARAADERVEAVETTVYADEASRVALASSTGLAGAFEATSSYAYLQAIAAANGDRQTGLGFGMGRSPEALDAEAIGREGAERAVSLLGATKPASRSCSVLLDPTVAASFIGFIGGLLCADAVQRGRSPFAGQLGTEVASEALTLADDGTDPAGLASAPIDGEGTPRRRTALIEGGTLAAYLHDSYTARRQGAGTGSTASASRAGYRSPPSVSTSNLIVEPGDAAFADLLRDAEGGVYVADVAGLHSGVNPVSGTFSVGATGRLVAGGELADAADEFTIASDLRAMLKAVRATGAEARWVPFGGSVRTPAVLIGEMAIGGA